MVTIVNYKISAHQWAIEKPRFNTPHNEILFTVKLNEIFIHATLWMKFETLCWENQTKSLHTLSLHLKENPELIISQRQNAY